MATKRLASWQITDKFWSRVEPLIPSSLRTTDREYRRKPGGEIEIVFKVWKSMLGMEQLNFHSLLMLNISVLLKRLLCIFTQSTVCRLETLPGNPKNM